MTAAHRSRVCTGLWLAICLAGSPAVADSTSTDDGLYGRLSGDVDISVTATANLRINDGLGVGSIARALYLSSAGPYVAFDAALSDSATARRTLATGICLRPLFLPRWGNGSEVGPAWLDLAVDSLSLELGALWTWPNATPSLPGLEVAVAAELPFRPRAAGLSATIRGALQWTSASLAAAAPFDSSPTLLLTIGLSWHTLANAHLVDAGDRLLR